MIPTDIDRRKPAVCVPEEIARKLIPADKHHQACLDRADRYYLGREWRAWMILAGTRLGDTVQFIGFSGNLLGIRSGVIRWQVIYEREGQVYSASIDQVLVPKVLLDQHRDDLLNRAIDNMTE